MAVNKKSANHTKKKPNTKPAPPDSKPAPIKHNLTMRQENFCHEYLKKSNASEAFRMAYDTSRQKPETVNRAAKTLMDNPKIKARIAELLAPAIKSVELTVEKHLINLETMRQAAFDAGNYQAAIRAEELKGKVGGFYVDRLETSSDIRVIVFDDAFSVGGDRPKKKAPGNGDKKQKTATKETKK